MIKEFEDYLRISCRNVNILELGKNIIDLGCLQALKVRHHSIEVDLTLPSLALPSKESVFSQVENICQKNIPSGYDVVVRLSSQVKPAAFQSLKKEGVCDVKNVVLVASGKGGVGKSTIAANVAFALAKFGCKTGLLDGDVYGPSVPTMFGISPKQEVQAYSDGGDGSPLMVPLESHGVKLMSIGFLVDDLDAMIWRGPKAASALIQMFGSVVWGDLDYLIVDLPPGTGDIQLSISQQISVAGSIIVSTPQDVALADVIRAKTMFDKVGIPILGLIENMSYFVCDGCDKRHEIFSHGGARTKAAELGIDFLEEVPLNSKICMSSELGIPFDGPSKGDMDEKFVKIAQVIAVKLIKKAMASPDLKTPPKRPVAGVPSANVSSVKKSSSLNVIN